MKKILNILLGILMAITVVLLVYAIATGGSDAAISLNLVWGYFLFEMCIRDSERPMRVHDFPTPG